MMGCPRFRTFRFLRQRQRCSRAGNRTVGPESGHVLQRLEREDLDDLPRRLGLEDGLFLGEGVDALARLGRRLLDDLDLHQAGDGEEAGAAASDVLLDLLVERIEDRLDLLLGELRLLGDAGEQLGLGGGLHSSGGGGGLFGHEKAPWWWVQRPLLSARNAKTEKGMKALRALFSAVFRCFLITRGLWAPAYSGLRPTRRGVDARETTVEAR